MKWTVITGAYGGLGRAFCNLYADKGCALWLIGKSEEKLNEIRCNLEKKVPVRISVCDLSDLHQLNYLCAELKNSSVERLINNAGIGDYGLFDESDLSRQLDMNQVNMTAVMMLSHAVLTYMKQEGGELLNVASTAAFQPGPLMAVYYASKAYVLSFSEALWAETKGTKAKVSVLCCGPMKTEFASKSKFTHTWMQKLIMVSAEKAVQDADFGLSKGKRCIVPGFGNQIALFFGRMMPKALLLSMMSAFQKQRKAEFGNK